jgi:hypothetical protein
MSSSFASSCASSGASTLFPGRSAACGPDGPVHTACLSTPSSSAPASNFFPFPDLSRHSKSGESGAPVSGGAAAACNGPFSAAIISRSAAPGAAVTCPLAPCCAAADCAAVPAMLLHPVAVELQVISSDPDQCPDSQISYGIDLSSARHSHDEQSPLPAARCVPMLNPAAAASACTVDDSAACTQRAPLYALCAVAALSPPHAPDPCFQPASTFSASVAAPASSRYTPTPDHLLPFSTASLLAAFPPSFTRPGPATGRALNQPHRLSSCDHATATQPCENARRWSFAPPASSSASFAGLGHAAAALVSTKGACQCSGAVCADDAPSLSSSRSTALYVDLQVQQQHGGGTKPLQQRIHERKYVQRVSRNTLKQPSLHPQLQPRPLRHEDGALQPCSSSRCFWTDAVVVAVLLCLSCNVNVAAAQLEASPGVWSTAALSVARTSPIATSLPNQGLAIIAGGVTGL